MNEKVKELIRIRKKFKASRGQFGTIFLGKTGGVVTNYENGRTEVPECVLMLARAWEKFYDEIKGNKK